MEQSGQKEAGESLSTQKRLSSRHDPGWNDPPKWAFTGNQSSSLTPTKRTLNKRVPFPLTSSLVADKQFSSETTSVPANMPPVLESSFNLTSAPHPPLMHPSDRDSETCVKQDEVTVDKSQTLEKALSNISTVIDEHIVEKSKADEIRKRLDIMKSVWHEDKLNSTIHSKVLELSKALVSKELQKADEIHLQLVMQYGNLCSTWIPGVRHIILALKTEHQNSSATDTQQSQPCLLPTGAKERN